MNWLVHLVTISATLNIAFGCNRIPPGTTAAKSPADDRYVVNIAGNPQNFEPGQKYNISLNAVQGYSFIGFMLAVESDGNSEGGTSSSTDPMRFGYFEILDFLETKFSDKCPNVVMHTNLLPKSKITVIWTAPPPGSGCILIRATVVEHREVWYMDDGFLTKQFCEDQPDDIDNQPLVMDPCCACDEAKYELTFEGKWSRHTHPKDFPANSWRTRFSDIIGASHTIDYRFWRYGELASFGLQEVAQYGSTRKLESELKEQSDQIRTIIKARGISYPNVTGKTFAVFRVDSKHHLISLVSMIDPSPDWIVGVSGLELCLPNCSWIENKVHNLYPWDAGTDSGPSYLSADQPQVPPDVIRRIKSNFPNDPRSPFYDVTGTPMKPLAVLHISRRRLYEKTCDNIEADNDPMECATHPWSRWTECSTKCGPGKQYRTREFKNPGLAKRFKCRKSLREEERCQGKKCGGFDENQNGNGGGGGGGGGGDSSREGSDGNYYPSGSPENPECALSEWSEWSSCSVTCGKGVKTQKRHYLNRKAKKKCQRVSKAMLEHTEECLGTDCGGEIDGNRADGEGGNEENENAEEANQEEQKNYEQKSFKKSRYGSRMRGGRGGGKNRNNEPFDDRNDPSQYGDGYENNQNEDRNDNDSDDNENIPPQCGVSPWSSWTPCSETCGVGQQSRERRVWNNDIEYGIRSASSFIRDPCRNIRKIEIVNCTISDCDNIIPDYCYEEPQVGPCRDSDQVNNFWYYDYRSDQCAIFFTANCHENRNKFTSKETCESSCKQRPKATDLTIEDLRLEPVHCVVSDWRSHACNASCGEGIQVKTREVLRTPKNGGKPCPKRLIRFEKCYKRCLDDNKFQQAIVKDLPDDLNENECRYSEWSVWSPCTASCGESWRQRTRTLLNTDLNYKCRDRVLRERCVMMPCLMTSNDDECLGNYC